MEANKAVGISKFETNKTITSIAKGIAISLVITFIMLAIYSIILTYTNVSENTIKPVVIILTAISILIGSTTTTFKLRKNGLMSGGIVGLIYMAVLYLISSITQVGFSLNMYSIIIMIVSILTGALGGIVGVNIRR